MSANGFGLQSKIPSVAINCFESRSTYSNNLCIVTPPKKRSKIVGNDQKKLLDNGRTAFNAQNSSSQVSKVLLSCF